MDTTFWVGIFIGAIFSLITSVAANLYSDRIRAYFTERRQVRLSNQKAKEIETYKFVSGLKGGDSPTLLIHQSRREMTTRLMLLAIMILVLFVAVGVTPASERLAHPNLFTAFHAVLFTFFLGLMSVAYTSIISTARNVYKAANFEQYEDDIRKKWGADAI